MDELADILQEVVAASSFDLGRRQTIGGGIKISFASRPEELISAERFRALHRLDSRQDDESASVTRARVEIPDDRLSQLCSYIRTKLGDYVDPATDRIGHAFPIGLGAHGRTTDGADGVVTFEESSLVENFARALVRGAAVLDGEHVASLVSGWVRGQPVQYRTRAILNGKGVLREPLYPVEGLSIASLPLSTDQLPGDIPTAPGRSERDYLGRVVVTIDHSAAPPLLRPSDAERVQAARVTGLPSLDFDMASQALSLVADTCLEPAFFWRDFADLSAFQLAPSRDTWSVGPGHFRSRSLTNSSLRTALWTGVSTLELDDDHELVVREEKLRVTLTALADGKSDKLQGAVSRWSRSMDSNARIEDQFIDLRIALESLYLKDFLNETTTQELRFRLSVFGAWHLGADFRERRWIRKRLRDAYDAASTAVHAGRIDSSPENRALLSDGQALCRRGIMKLIDDGEPRDWGDLILGDGADLDVASESRP